MSDKLNDYLIEQARAKFVPFAVQYLTNKTNGITDAENLQPITRYTDSTDGDVYNEFEDGTIVVNNTEWFADLEHLADARGETALHRMDSLPDAFLRQSQETVEPAEQTVQALQPDQADALATMLSLGEWFENREFGDPLLESLSYSIAGLLGTFADRYKELPESDSDVDYANAPVPTTEHDQDIPF